MGPNADRDLNLNENEMTNFSIQNDQIFTRMMIVIMKW